VWCTGVRARVNTGGGGREVATEEYRGGAQVYSSFCHSRDRAQHTGEYRRGGSGYRRIREGGAQHTGEYRKGGFSEPQDTGGGARATGGYQRGVGLTRYAV